MKKKIIIIGSGFGALGAAARLLAAGHDVTVFEKRDKLGGRAYVYEMDGFKFDGGPTIVTAPFMFDDIYEAAGKRREDYFELVKCDPVLPHLRRRRATLRLQRRRDVYLERDSSAQPQG